MLSADDSIRLQALFSELSELPAARRAACIEQLRAESPALAAELESLLVAHDEAGSFLGRLDATRAADLLYDDEPFTPPERAGPWRLVREIGRGGLGVVYLGERDQGDFEQRVAIKLIKRGMDSELILKRFNIERRILASLEHPNIARLIDGGMLEDGRPYFAMEYIEGTPLTEWCDRNKATIGQRLKLFEQVCRAVQYAHARLIVHRDLKPANILVAETLPPSLAKGAASEASGGCAPVGANDGAGKPRWRSASPRRTTSADPLHAREGGATVKLLDFGIAKLLDEEGEGGTTLTVAGTRAMTPEYAAPEQVRGEPVSTATDVYALGVVLYELLAGDHPFGNQATTRERLAKAICDTVPMLPSAAVTGNCAMRVAESRSSRPRALRRHLHGDLDNVVMRAMSKEPGRRYGSAEALAEDVRRHLEGLPVKARRETVAYRVNRFVYRHRMGVAVTAAFALLLVFSIVVLVLQQAVTTYERDQARLERDKAEAVTAFLTGLFEEADPFNEHQGAMTVQEALEAGARRLQTELGDRPVIRAHLLRAIGWIYLQHYQPRPAGPLIEEALAIERELHDDAHPDLAKAIGYYSAYLSRSGDKEGAVILAREALDMRRQLYGEHSEIVARGLGSVGVALMEAGRCVEAEPVLREALTVYERVTGRRDLVNAGYLNILGRTLTALGRYEEAEALLREATEYREALFEPDHPGMATVHGNLGVILMHQGRFGEAEPLLSSALDINRQAFGEGHYRVALLLDSLGELEWWLGSVEQAVAYHREALTIRQRHQFHDQVNTARGLTLLARLEHARGNHEDAERLFRQALAAFPDKLAETDLTIAQSRLGLGRLLLDMERIDEAEPLLEDALARRLAGTGPDSDLTAEARVALGLLRAAQGQSDQAITLLELGLAQLGNFALADPAMVEAGHDTLASLSGRDAVRPSHE